MFKLYFLIITTSVITVLGGYFQVYEQEALTLLSSENPVFDVSNCSEVKENLVKLLLFTRSNPSHPINLAPSTVRKLDLKKRSLIVVHGWNNVPSPWMWYVKDAYLRHEDLNVILLDWSAYTDNPFNSTICYTYKVAKTVANSIHKYAFDLKKLRLIGFSLGGQLVGLIGKEVSNITRGKKIKRITALDVAGPWFDKQPKQIRIGSGDADFVDAIHTDQAFYGMKERYGHVDFFPNGGYHQPGCEEEDKPREDDCNHERAVEYLVESLTLDSFTAIRCGSYDNFKARLCKNNPVVLMGEYCPEGARGTYYLETNPKPPFGKYAKYLCS